MNEPEVVTLGAHFLAKVYYEAYQTSQERSSRYPMPDWGSLSRTDKNALASGFQKLFDREVLTPINYQKFLELRQEDWKSCQSRSQRNA